MSVGLDYLFVIAHKRNYSIHISTNPIKFPCLLLGNDAVIAGVGTNTAASLDRALLDFIQRNRWMNNSNLK